MRRRGGEWIRTIRISPAVVLAALAAVVDAPADNATSDLPHPAARIAPYLESLQTAGVSLVCRPQQRGG